MRILVTGGRDYQDRDHVFDVLDRIHAKRRITFVIHGACGWDRDKHNGEGRMTGADRWADEWARERGISFHRVAARWSMLGNKAGPIRNSEMIAMGPELVVAFPGDVGTADCIAKGRAKNIRVVAYPARERAHGT
jgi:hypothetical protein